MENFRRTVTVSTVWRKIGDPCTESRTGRSLSPFTCEIEITIDLDLLARDLAMRSVWSSERTCTILGGIIAGRILGDGATP
jgi:hypothetical protein